MGQVLYRKYRSKSLDQIIGQEHITDTLAEALKQGRISHAYLFTGPRGVGKTSIARILAHEINNLPYDDDSSHIDIIEIDAASNRRIDEIRDLREKVYMAPTSAKYKVYIIDEVHMLTKEAFNALLKTLEEPPEHVIFILATTDAHKLPETIISRTQRYNFKPVAKSQVIDHLANIAKKEGIEVTPEALQLLAEHGEGSFRDSISLLDQASNRTDKLDLAAVQQQLGLPPTQAITDLIAEFEQGTASGLMTKLNILYDEGYQANVIAKQINANLRDQFISGNVTRNSGNVMDLLGDLIDLPVSYNPDQYLELCLIKHQITAVTANKQAKSEQITAEPVIIKEELLVEEVAFEEPIEAEVTPEVIAAGDQPADDTIWPQVLQALKQKYNTLYGVVRMAQPKFTDKELVLAFEFAFHEKRIQQNSNKQIITDIIYGLTGKKLEVKCILDKAAIPPKPVVEVKTPPRTEDLAAISNIFGDAELLES